MRKGHSDHWDFVRGLSMAVMIVMHTTDIVGWRPFVYQLMSFSYPVIEPIIFLSGFLICWRTRAHLLKEKVGTSSMMKIYAARRVVRTWPMYFAFVLLCFSIPALPEFPIQKSLLSFLTFTMNFNLNPSGLGHLWTLCLEEWCYLIFLLLIPFVTKPWIRYVFLTLAMQALILRALIIWHEGPLDYRSYFRLIHYFTLTHWDSFWWGCLLATFYKGPMANRRTGGYLLFCSFLFFALCLVLAFHLRRGIPLAVLQVSFPLLGALGSAFLVLGIPSASTKWLRRSGLVKLGVMSYTFYLSHKVLMAGFIRLNRQWEWLPPMGWLELLGSYAFMLGAGTILFYAFEVHILRFLQTKLSFKGSRTVGQPTVGNALR